VEIRYPSRSNVSNMQDRLLNIYGKRTIVRLSCERENIYGRILIKVY